MKRWIHILLFTIIIGLAKAHSFIKLVILAGLGLAGLWMVHTLAQDYGNIQQNNRGLLGGTGLTADSEDQQGERQGLRLFKRSVNSSSDPRINWEVVMRRDPASCARSFICQLAAIKNDELVNEEKIILKITRNSAEASSWASKQLQEALKNGQANTSDPRKCMKIYKFCPYTKHMMMTLLKMFGK